MLLVEELIHGDGDVASESDRAGTASVVEAVMQPGDEGVPDVFGIEEIVVEQNAVSHAEAHGGIVGPNSHESVSTLELTFHHCVVDIQEALLDDVKPFFFELHELSAGTQCVSDRHPQYCSYLPRNVR